MAAIVVTAMALVWTAAAVAAEAAPAPLALEWSEGRLPLQAQAGAAVGLAGDYMVVAGGTHWPTLDFKRYFAWTQLYDLRSGVWSMGPDVPRDLAYAAYASYGGKVYLFGGCGPDRKPTTESFVFSQTGATPEGKPVFAWTPGTPLPEPLVFAMGDCIGSTFYLLAGGKDYDLKNISNDLYALDLSAAQGEWKKLAPLPGSPTSMPGFAACGGKLYAFGGYRTDKDPAYNVADSYCYDPARNAWTAIRAMPFANRCATALGYDDRRLLLFGPYIGSAEDVAVHGADYGVSGAALLYDTQLDTYTPLQPMPRALTTISFVRQGDLLYGVGGEMLYKIRSPYLYIAKVKKTP
jgi:N-acetylneuraminic acid mutarotase